MEQQQIRIPKPLTSKTPSEILDTTELIQCSSRFKKVYKDGTVKHCAIGALLEELWDGRSFTKFQYPLQDEPNASWVEINYQMIDNMENMFPKLSEYTTCPACPETGSIMAMIPHLNNTTSNSHGWTFKQIAAWLKENGL